MSSQFNQDEWVIQQLCGKEHGFFIDSGAGMGVAGSNTYRLETTYKWSGICVEPVPEFFEDLQRTRTCHLVQAALSDANGKATFVIPSNLWLAGLEGKLGSDIWSSERAKATRKIEVNTVAIDYLLDEFKAPLIIDYWSLDTEGSEFEVLKTFPWNKHRLKLLTIEHNQEEPKRGLISSYLKERNFNEVQLTENEFAFINNDIL